VTHSVRPMQYPSGLHWSSSTKIQQLELTRATRLRSWPRWESLTPFFSLIFDHCNNVPLMIVKGRTFSLRLLCYDPREQTGWLKLNVGWTKDEGLEKQFGASERPISHATNFPSCRVTILNFVYQSPPLHRHTIIATYRILPRGEPTEPDSLLSSWVLSPRVITAIDENAGIQIQNSNGTHSGIDVLATRAEAWCITSQPCYNTTQFIWPTNPTYRIRTGPFVKELRLLIKVCCRHSVCAP